MFAFGLCLNQLDNRTPLLHVYLDPLVLYQVTSYALHYHVQTLQLPALETPSVNDYVSRAAPSTVWTLKPFFDLDLSFQSLLLFSFFFFLFTFHHSIDTLFSPLRILRLQSKDVPLPSLKSRLSCWGPDWFGYYYDYCPTPLLLSPTPTTSPLAQTRTNLQLPLYYGSRTV